MKQIGTDGMFLDIEGRNYVQYRFRMMRELLWKKDAANCENVWSRTFTGQNLETFENGEEFLKQYVIRDDELVILDLDMPVKNGIDVLQELEKNSEK